MSVLSFHFIRNPHSSCDEVSLVSCEGTNGTFICYFLQLADPNDKSNVAADIVTPTKVVEVSLVNYIAPFQVLSKYLSHSTTTF